MKWRLDATDGADVAELLLPEDAEEGDELDGVDPEATTPMVRKLIDDKERREADEYYAENLGGDGEDGER